MNLCYSGYSFEWRFPRKLNFDRSFFQSRQAGRSLARIRYIWYRWQEYDISAASVLAMGVDGVLFDLPFYNRECVFARSGIEHPNFFELVLEVVVSWGDKFAKMCVCSGLALVKEPTRNNPTKAGSFHDIVSRQCQRLAISFE
jgi:hypothetical protein